MTKQQKKIVEYLSVEDSWADNTYRAAYGNPWNFDDLIVYSPDNGVPEESHVPQIATHVWLDRIGTLSVRLSKHMQKEIERPASSYKEGEEEIGLSCGTYNQQNPFTTDFHFEWDNRYFGKKYLKGNHSNILAVAVCVSDDIRGLSSHAMIFKCEQKIAFPFLRHFTTERKNDNIKWNGKLWEFNDGKEIPTNEWFTI